MIKLVSLLCSLLIASACPAQCICEKYKYDDPVVDCDTASLRNGALLYYRYNCDSIWLTYQRSGIKTTVYSTTETALSPDNYRIGYYLIAETDRTLLFRYGCPANGPCLYSIFNKQSRTKKEGFALFRLPVFYRKLVNVKLSKDEIR